MKPLLILGRYAGFCYGVASALNMVYNHIHLEKLCTYGDIIHNKQVINDLKSKGVEVIENIDDANGRTVAIRTHGISKAIYDYMDKNNIKYIDCTCKHVKKIHNIVLNASKKGLLVIVIGDCKHPEVAGIAGFSQNGAIVLNSKEQALNTVFDKSKKYCVVVQTTFIYENYIQILNILKEAGIELEEINNTICNATSNRQYEAESISKNVDIMLVIGDKKSSNTVKLFEICYKNCKKTFLIETIDDLVLNNLNLNGKIGITAGASTPPDTIKGALIKMNELDKSQTQTQTFEEMLGESITTLHTGDIVKGTVIQVSNGEVSVNLGYKSDGIIPRSEFSEDQTIDPSEIVKPGDPIEVFVVRVNDGEGNVMLSRKKIEANKSMVLLEAAYNEKTVVSGKVIEIVKGGLIALVGGVRIFVPSSQASNRYVEDLSVFIGKEFNFNIIEFDKSKRRIVGSRKNLAAIEQAESKERVFNTIAVGQKIKGIVTRIVEFGAFVDVGGVDGLVHISELSWSRIPKVQDVLKEGDQVTVCVLAVDKEKGKISLSLKNVEGDPWNNIAEKYPVGQVISGKVVRMVPFGAFIELEEGLDGLVHVSQIAKNHVEKPEDVLSIGENINVKVIGIDPENKRISLSKKAADLAEQTA